VTSSKLQVPSSREIPNSKLQTSRSRRSFDVWCLELLWLLALAAWGFCCPVALPLTAAESEPNPRAGSDQTAIALEALSRLKGVDLDTNPTLKAAVLRVLEQVRGRQQFVEVVRDFKIKGQARALLEIVTRYPNDSAGVEATRLIMAGEEVDLLRESIASTNANRVIEALGNSQDKAIVPLLQPVVTNSACDVAVRQAAVRALARVEPGAAALLAITKSRSLPDDLKLVASSELNSARWPQIKAEAAELLPLPNKKIAEPLPPVVELLKMKGDAVNGARVFRLETVGCLKCHQINGEGIDFGPNLSEIGTKLAKDALYDSILNPSAGISVGYEAWQLELKNGDEPYGLLVSETAEEISIKSIGGIVTKYKQVEVAKREKQKVSIMPSGLDQAMSREELVDLVEYLFSLKKRTQ
jgi:putative heme-binding domain-containing protein